MESVVQPQDLPGDQDMDFFSAINIHKKKAHSLIVPFGFGLRRSQTVVDFAFAITAYQ